LQGSEISFFNLGYFHYIRFCMSKILLSEDEHGIADSVRGFLSLKGFDVDWAINGKEAIDLIEKQKYEAAVIDLRTPFADGFEVCRCLRKKQPETGVIILTAYSRLEDKLTAFDSGADDYLTKPFHLDELYARIQSILRRRNKGHTEASENNFKLGDFELDFRNKAASRAGININLSVKEYMLLEYLVKNHGNVISKNEIAKKVWDINFETGTNTIEVYINFLRNKIDKGHHPKLIHTKTGFGYYFKDETPEA